MKTAYLFPAKVKPVAANLDRARLVVPAVTFNRKLENASKKGRLRCSCGWCLAPVSLSHRHNGRTSLFAHKPNKAKANCPNYFPSHRERQEPSRRDTWNGDLFQDGKPVLLVPLTQEMVDLYGEAHESRDVLFVIPQTEVERLGLSVPPRVPASPTPPEGEHVH